MAPATIERTFPMARNANHDNGGFDRTASPAPFSKRLLRVGGMAVAWPADEPRYLYDDGSYDRYSTVDGRAKTLHLQLPDDKPELAFVEANRLKLIFDTLVDESLAGSERDIALKHLGCTAVVLPSEAEGSIIPFKLPKTATVDALEPRLDNVA